MTKPEVIDRHERIDGRHAWRERNRSAVVDALLDFYQEGKFDPGAQEIAERSGVSRRSLFRYFDDMNDMCRVAIERHIERVSHLFELDDTGEGPLGERINRLVEQRLRLYERIAPVRRLARIRAHLQPLLAARLGESSNRLRRQVERHFERELATMDAELRHAALDAADTAVSFEAYDHLATTPAMTRGRIKEAMRLGLLSLFRDC